MTKSREEFITAGEMLRIQAIKAPCKCTYEYECSRCFAIAYWEKVSNESTD